MRLQQLSLSILLAMLASPAIAAPDWTIDSSHSAAQFKVRHMMVSNVNGAISGIKGTVGYDGDIKSLKVTATLDPKTVNTNDAQRDTHLKSADFFDVEKFPTMSFVSKRVEKGSDDKFKLIGDLTMHGVTKEVALDVEGPCAIVKDKKGKERTGASASAKINRKDFGMEWNHALDTGGVAVSDQIDISLDIEMNRGVEKTAAAQ